MLSQFITLARYAVRSTGLLIVIGCCLVAACVSVFGEKRSLPALASALWVGAAAVLSWPRIPDAWRRDPPTEKQLAYAQALGIQVPDGISKGRLSDLISLAKEQQ